MLKCREIHSLGDAYVDGCLPWRTRVSLRLHILMCVHCRRYLSQLAALLRAFRHVHPPASADEVDAVMARLREVPEGADETNL